MIKAANLRCAFNRLVLILLALAGLAAGAFFIATPSLAVATASNAASAALAAPIATIEAAAVATAAISALILVIEIVGNGGSRMFEANIDGGSVEYPADVITYALESDLKEIDGIEDARVRMEGDRQKAVVYATLAVNPTDDGHSYATRASSTIHERLEGLGLQAGPIRLTFRPSHRKSLNRERRIANPA